MGRPESPDFTEDMSARDFYVAQKKYEKDLYNRVDYGEHYCSYCKKRTKHKITYNAFRTVYTCTVCGAID